MMSPPAGDERQKRQCKACADHPLVKGWISEKAQPEKGEETDHEGHRGTVDGAQK
jgi:hypothetical protein